jgi:hypothetical protein
MESATANARQHSGAASCETRRHYLLVHTFCKASGSGECDLIYEKSFCRRIHSTETGKEDKQRENAKAKEKQGRLDNLPNIMRGGVLGVRSALRVL